MSSYKAALQIEGSNYEIRHCSFNYRQNIKPDGSPHAQILAGEITVTLEAPAPKEIIQWMLTPDEKRSGVIRFYEVNSSTGTHQVLEFADAYCVQLDNVFEGEKHLPGGLLSSFMISSASLIFNGITFNK
ncbi:hypothetical protein SAMN05421788_114117 [Filimonas lacunae]|uniref:Uncharacterized protein n=1 Tax=Filimonas lacunae TaxID=477680 RepID=A0A173MLL6_9BACT|nr:type VI secretion system tube protein TssD [Filimonas lacunae]BAV08533.1 hypothetical protein FLA_4574 [Filimonas lacunae]SIT34091.1 hypothetical protein SAMN05421788_114117 [Filimonas lacunae]